MWNNSIQIVNVINTNRKHEPIIGEIRLSSLSIFFWELSYEFVMWVAVSPPAPVHPAHINTPPPLPASLKVNKWRLPEASWKLLVSDVTDCWFLFQTFSRTHYHFLHLWRVITPGKFLPAADWHKNVSTRRTRTFSRTGHMIRTCRITSSRWSNNQLMNQQLMDKLTTNWWTNN